MYHRDLWEELVGKDKLAYPCSQVLPIDSLSYPSDLRSPRSLCLLNNREICLPAIASRSGEVGGCVPPCGTRVQKKQKVSRRVSVCVSPRGSAVNCL
jgi:hypothetical protein